MKNTAGIYRKPFAGGESQAAFTLIELLVVMVIQIGFTTRFRPNEKVLCTQSGEEYDVDWTNWQEGKLLTAGTLGTEPPTYAAVTARSYHSGGVNVSMMDGSVRWFADTINRGVWQAYSTRSGGETIPPDQQGR